MRRAELRLGALLGPDAPFEFGTPEALDWSELAVQADVLLSCAPYRFNPRITQACVDAGLAM